VTNAINTNNNNNKNGLPRFCLKIFLTGWISVFIHLSFLTKIYIAIAGLKIVPLNHVGTHISLLSCKSPLIMEMFCTERRETAIQRQI
jgi:hypothetical protein